MSDLNGNGVEQEQDSEEQNVVSSEKCVHCNVEDAVLSNFAGVYSRLTNFADLTLSRVGINRTADVYDTLLTGFEAILYDRTMACLSAVEDAFTPPEEDEDVGRCGRGG